MKMYLAAFATVFVGASCFLLPGKFVNFGTSPANETPAVSSVDPIAGPASIIALAPLNDSPKTSALHLML